MVSARAESWGVTQHRHPQNTTRRLWLAGVPLEVFSSWSLLFSLLHHLTQPGRPQPAMSETRPGIRRLWPASQRRLRRKSAGAALWRNYSAQLLFYKKRAGCCCAAELGVGYSTIGTIVIGVAGV